MKSRVRPPSLVSMWMLDVFCCALGCVTLLWLLNTRQAKVVANDLSAQKDKLVQANARITESEARVASGTSRITTLEAELARLNADRDKLMQALKEQEGVVVRLNARLKVLETENANTIALMSEKDAEIKDLTAKLRVVNTRMTDLARDLKAKDSEVAAALTARDATKETLASAAAERDKARADAKRYAERVAELEAMAAKGDAAMKASNASDVQLREQLGKLRAQLDAESEKFRTLAEEFGQSKRQVIDLQGQKRALEGQLRTKRDDETNRFEGLALSGKRVVFLVDASGSMNLLELGVPAPNKWKTVIDTLEKVMRSIPELEEFQVVTFGTDVEFPLGGEGRWIPFDREALDRVRVALTRRTPDGYTNLSGGFERAFRYRAQGLDSIYLLSDGLPTVGLPLREDQLRLDENQRVGIIVPWLRRQVRDVWNAPRNGQTVKVHSLGFFYESPDVGAFLWALSRENGGGFVGMSRP